MKAELSYFRAEELICNHMEISPIIFRAYDIRGIYPTEINEAAAKLIAQAFLQLLTYKLAKPTRELRIAVGRDIRKSSKPLLKAVLEVFLNYGSRIDDLGLISINDLYFAAGSYKYDGGIMVTASHNPPEYGGFKMIVLNKKVLNSFEFISGIELYQTMLKLEQAFSAETSPGSVTKKDIFPDHLKHILSFIELAKIKPLKVVVDAGNGMAGLMVAELFKKLPCKLIPLFFKPEQNFSNRSPNPLVPGAHLKAKEKILETNADLGVIFDVDGDRIFLIDEQGQFIQGDMTLLLISKSMLEKNPGSGIVYNLICSHAVIDLITSWGGKAIRSEVGYMNLAKHMLNESGILSGEVSGHYAFKDSFYSDNAFIALVLILQTISEDGRKLSEIIKDYSLYARGDEINLTVENIPEELEKIREHYKENILDEIDGITAEFPLGPEAMSDPPIRRGVEWWFNVRPSNTEPLLRITVEAKNQEELKRRQEEVLGVINK